MAEALKRYNEATDTWVPVATVNRIEVGGGPPEPVDDYYIYPADWHDVRTITDDGIFLVVSDEYDEPLNIYHYDGVTIDWGDGNIEVRPFNVTSSHIYVKGTGKPCTRGYTTFLVRIYNMMQNPTSTGLISMLRLIQNRNILAIYFNLISYPTLRVHSFAVSLVNLEYFKWGAQTTIMDISELMVANTGVICIESDETSRVITRLRKAFFRNQRLRWVDLSNLTASDTSNIFGYCHRLQKVKCKFISMAEPFVGCYSPLDLSEVDISSSISLSYGSGCTIKTPPTFDKANIRFYHMSNNSYEYTVNSPASPVIFGDMINPLQVFDGGWTSLTNLDIENNPNLITLKIDGVPNLTSVNIGASTYNEPHSTSVMNLLSVEIKNTPSIISLYLRHQRSLKNIALENLPNVTILNLRYCDQLTGDLIIPDAFKTSVIDIFGCTKIDRFIGLTLARDITTLINGTFALGTGNVLKEVILPFARFSSLTVTLNGSLERLVFSNLGTFTSLNLSGNKFSAEALNEVFTNLHTPSVLRTIHITNNPGAATCDRSIATAKNWNVVG